MKELILIIILNLLICRCYGVIYKLNDSEYSRMPPVFHLDDYDYCVTDPEGVYCAVEIDVVSDTTNELYTMMRNYTEYDTKHFNHTLLRHGICVTQTCKKIVRRNKTDTAVDKHKRNSEDIKLLLEECLNESLWNNYELKCRITVPPYCNEKDDPGSDAGDLAMGVFLLVLLTMNVIGSLYDVIAVRGKNKKGNSLLLCFSVPHNFSRLINPFAHFGPREQRLKALHGLRAITMICVISCHSLLPFGIAPENAHYVEALYDNLAYYIFLNGMIVVQTFFIISGCLLSYKLELYAEKREIKWTLLPKTLIVNWAKLTPSYMVVLAFTVTWMRYTGSGPFWEISAIKEIEDCQMNGWKHALYINNYFDHTQCLAHTWYLAANMQLIILGYTTCILVKRGKFRTTAIIFLFIVGILTPIAHTYFQGLDPVLMVNPESARYFMDNPTFNHVYKRGHTNIVNFILGIALGFLIYHLQKNDVDIQMKYKKYRYLFLLTFPAIFATILIGSIFYQEDTYISIYLKSIYAGLIKPAYGIVLAILIIGCVFKIENVYRPILEWNGWKVPGKLSYCAFLLHLTLVRVATGRLKTLIPTDNLRIIEIMFAYIVMSYLMAIPLWLLVDAPLTEFLLKLLNGRLFQRTKGTKIISDNDTALQISMIMTDTGEGNAGL